MQSDATTTFCVKSMISDVTNDDELPPTRAPSGEDQLINVDVDTFVEASPAGSSYTPGSHLRLTVKNTFISLSPATHQCPRRRSNTLPATDSCGGLSLPSPAARVSPQTPSREEVRAPEPVPSTPTPWSPCERSPAFLAARVSSQTPSREEVRAPEPVPSTPTPWSPCERSPAFLHCCTPTPWAEHQSEAALSFHTLAAARPPSPWARRWPFPAAQATGPVPEPEPARAAEMIAAGAPPSATTAAVVAPAAVAACAACCAAAPAGRTSRITASVEDRNVSVAHTMGGACRLQWTVDAKRLKGSDKQVVSAPFEVTLQEGTAPVSFKIVLYPKFCLGGGGGASFKKAGGVGHVQLKCCSELPEGFCQDVALRICVGGGARTQAARGPFVHSFASSSVFNAPKELADWNFGASVESSSHSFEVAVEMATAGGA